MENAFSISSGLVILFAEDDQDFFIITRYALKQAGFTGVLRLVKNSEDLMKYLQREGSPHLIILDLNNTPNDWRGALRDLKADKRYEKLPVVVLTASSELQDIELCGKYPRSCYIEKPLYFEEWKACMEDIIRKNLSSPSPGA